MKEIAAVDMFVAPPASLKLLYALVELDHHRRRVIHFNVTRNPTRVWLPRPITEALYRTLLSATRPRYVIWPRRGLHHRHERRAA